MQKKTPVMQFANSYIQIPAMTLKPREESDIIQAGKTLREYYEGTPLFYTDGLRRPKIFKPILLYHSYTGESNENSSDEASHSLTHADGNLPEQVRLQYSHLEISRCKTDELVSKKEFAPQTDKTTQQTAITKIEHFETSKTSHLEHCSHKEVNSLACDTQAQEISITSKFIQNSYSNTIKDLETGYHRSAFSKPRRFQVLDSGSSNTVSQGVITRVENFGKVQWDLENAGNEIQGCSLQHFPVSLQNDSVSDISTDAQRNTLTYYGCHRFLPSNHQYYPLRENCSADWEQHLLFSRLMEIHQMPTFQWTYDSMNPIIYGLNSPVFHSHCLDDRLTIPVSLKPNVGSGSIPKQFSCQVCDSTCTTAVKPKNHARARAAQKLHKCECGRAFARNEELTRHKRIHSGQRPFRCSLCGKTFGRKDHLSKHRTTHLHTSEKKVHVCDVQNCLQRYTRSDALARHQWAAHGIRARVSKWRPHP